MTDAIPLLNGSECSYVHFRQHHLLPNKPCLISPKLVEDWQIRRKISRGDGAPDWEYLEDTFGRYEAVCVDCEARDEAGKGDQAEVRTFGELLALWKAGKGRTKYLKDWHLPLLVYREAERLDKGKGKERVREELYEVPRLCLDDWMNEWEGSEGNDDFRFVYAGGGSTFTPLHRDVYCSYSISTQLYGRKKWFLFPPSCTPHLLPLITEAERNDTSVSCDEWSDERKEEFRARGMMVVEQKEGESIFIPSGYYHSVHNLTHPTVSLNHNWLNSHNLPDVYRSLSDEVERCRVSIEDVNQMMIERATRKGEGEEGWREDWEAVLDELVERSGGWSWPKFWRMMLNTIRNLEVPLAVLEERAAKSRWSLIPPDARPSTSYVLDQVRPLVLDFRQRPEAEWRWLAGIRKVIEGVEAELNRLEGVVRATKTGDGADEAGLARGNGR
ncbi:jumonji domain containing protein [Rhodotorula toruloides]|uniref:Jumonji domain containing protein n=1 Tax=Rhodotorula toruloides TaxID=5286 RepID=A0A511KG87_RHOTO|nr:jumonji domain containing protein [Rhodotorula toruloides]